MPVIPYNSSRLISLKASKEEAEENTSEKAPVKVSEEAEEKVSEKTSGNKKTLPSKVKQLRELYNERDSRINWAKKKMVMYLRSKGVKMPLIMTFTKAVEMVTELPEQS